MTKTKVLFLGLILFFCFAKAQSQNVDVDALNSDLISTWTWFKTIHNYESSGPIPDDTPILCKCNRRIVFRNNFQVEQYSNDTLVSTESYSIEKVRYNESDRAILRSKLVNGQISLINDTLGIGWFGSCASLRFYIKSKNLNIILNNIELAKMLQKLFPILIRATSSTSVRPSVLYTILKRHDIATID